MDLPAFAAFDKAHPAAFYLGTGEEFPLLADATIVAGQHALPVHSHVLAGQSRVLRSLFAAQRGGELAKAAPKASESMEVGAARRSLASEGKPCKRSKAPGRRVPGVSRPAFAQRRRLVISRPGARLAPSSGACDNPRAPHPPAPSPPPTICSVPRCAS